MKINKTRSRCNCVVLEGDLGFDTLVNHVAATLQKIVDEVALPSLTRGESVGALSIDLSADNISFKNGTVGVLSLVPADELLVLIGTPVLTTVGELEMALDSLVCIPGASVDVSVFVVESTLSLKSVVLPLAVVLVAVYVVALTVAIGVSLEEGTLVVVISGPFLLSVASGEALFPVTVVVATSFVSELTLTVVEVVFKATFIKIAIVLPAFAITVALAVGELGFSNITVVVGHLTPTSLSTVLELALVGFLVLTGLVDVLTLTVEHVVGHHTLISVTLMFTSSVLENTVSVGFTIDQFSFIPAS